MYQIGGEAAWYSTRTRWSAQDRLDLAVLCEGAIPVEKAADILGRSPSSIAWNARDAGLTLPPSWRALVAPKAKILIKPKAIQLHYPYLIRARPSDAELLRVNDLVPRAFPEHMRADICQSVMLSLYEGDITLAEIEANRSQLSWFVKRWRKEQTPYQEIQIEGHADDDRDYYDIAANVWNETKLTHINDARHAREAFVDHQPATQIEDVFTKERNAWHFVLAGKHPDRIEIDEMIERGDVLARDLNPALFRPWDRVRNHARRQLKERHGIDLTRRMAEALIDYCRDREPEQQDREGELHLFVQGKLRLPIVYGREKDEIVTILPTNGALGGGWLSPHQDAALRARQAAS